MKINPLKEGVLTENSAGIGTVTRKMVRERAAELALINSEPPEASVKIPWSRLFQFRQAWSYVIGKFMTDCFWWFYLFGAPVFFAERFGTDLKGRMGPLATIYVLASFGSIGGYTPIINGRGLTEDTTAAATATATLLLSGDGGGACVVVIVCDRGDRYFAPMKWERRYVW